MVEALRDSDFIILKIAIYGLVPFGMVLYLTTPVEKTSSGIMAWSLSMVLVET